MTDTLPEDFRSGFVAVVGRPNVGKSTLMNALLGQKVAITSPKAQTTRRRQLGILTDDQMQMIFVDTPGINTPRRKLDDFMRREALSSLQEVDVALWVVDITTLPDDHEQAVAELLQKTDGPLPVIIAMNHSDRLKPEHVLPHTEAYRALVPAAEWMLTSATRGDNLEKLRAMLIAALPVGPQYYPPDQVTDTLLRDLAAELIREAALNLLKQEVPHGVAVEIESFIEVPGRAPHIQAALWVERANHKAIVIGKGGQMLKQIGMAARKEIEAQLEQQVFLELFVKVVEDWRDDPRRLDTLGYR